MTAIFLTISLICLSLGILDLIANTISVIVFKINRKLRGAAICYVASCIFYGIFYYLTH